MSLRSPLPRAKTIAKKAPVITKADLAHKKKLEGLAKPGPRKHR
jgi:hypothetical protein